jgi:hypothetical protein
VDEDAFVATLLDPSGYPSRRPSGGRAGVFLNKAEEPAALEAASRIAVRLVPPYAFVVAGSARAGWARPMP